MPDLRQHVLCNRAEGEGGNTLSLTQFLKKANDTSLTLIKIQRVKKDDIPFESPN